VSVPEEQALPPLVLMPSISRLNKSIVAFGFGGNPMFNIFGWLFSSPGPFI